MKKRQPLPARAILFDWDGTLLDSFAGQTRAYLAMFRVLGITWDTCDLARYYSPNWYRVYLAARLPRDRWVEADRLWTRAYKQETPRLLPGARKTVQALHRDFVLGIVSSGNRPRVRREIRKFRLARHFSACVCNEDCSMKKPHPAPLKLALARLKLDPAECVYVGDAPEDIEMARRAGVRPIGVLGPFPTAARLRAARPEVLLTSIAELPRFLKALS